MLSRAKFFQVFRRKIKRAVFFYLLANSVETAYLTSEMDSFLTPYGLSNSGKEKLQFTPFGGFPSPAAQAAFAPDLSKAITFLS